MNKEIVIQDENNNDIKVSCLGIFQIPGLDKQYIIYSLINDNSDKAAVLIGEYIIDSNGNHKVLGVKESEKDLVIAYSNEIINQLGE